MGNQELSKDRTLARNASVWKDFDIALYAPNLTKLSTDWNNTHQSVVYQYINAFDYDTDILTEIRDRMFDLEMYGVTVEKEIAQNKYETKIATLTLKTAGENLILSAKEYDTAIQSLIMSAREYAAFVEREELYLEKDRAIMAIEREEAKVLEYQARTMLEQFEQKSVEIDIAKAKLQVAQENVKVILAQIAVEEAGIKAIEKELELALVEVEDATLQADIAQILTEIVTKGLISIRLQVEKEEIALTPGWLQSFLDDTLDLYNKRILTMKFQAEAEQEIGITIPLLLEVDKAIEYLKINRIESAQSIWNLEKSKIESYKFSELLLKEQEFEVKENFEMSKQLWKTTFIQKQTWEAELLSNARKWVYLNYHDVSEKDLFLNQIIHQGVGMMPIANFGSTGEGCSGGG
jgi:hypothetical protein